MSLMPDPETFNTVDLAKMMPMPSVMPSIMDGLYATPTCPSKMKVPYLKLDEASAFSDVEPASIYHYADTHPAYKIEKASFSVSNELAKKYADLGAIDIKGEITVKFSDLELYQSMQMMHDSRYSVQQVPGFGQPFKRPRIDPLYTSDIRSFQDFKQAVFDRIVKALRAQGRAGAQVIKRYVGNPMTMEAECKTTIASMYRASDGSRCGVGYLIPDENYSPGLEHKMAGCAEVMEAMDLGQFVGDPEVVPFLNEIQKELHDSFADSPRFRCKFEDAVRVFARQHGLNVQPQSQSLDAYSARF